MIANTFSIDEAKQQIAQLDDLADAKRVVDELDAMKNYFCELSIYASIRLGELTTEGIANGSIAPPKPPRKKSRPAASWLKVQAGADEVTA
jgi:hypothetical protein